MTTFHTGSGSDLPASSRPGGWAGRRADRLSNSLYADICRDEIWGVLDDLLDWPVLADREAIHWQLLDMRHRGLITLSELSDGIRVPLIARARADKAHRGPLFVGAALLTFSRADLETAARRAAVIARVTGVPTVAFVAAHCGWPAEADEVARQLGVTIVRYKSDEYVKYMGDDCE